jgi:osmoprotectant transport system permease protein
MVNQHKNIMIVINLRIFKKCIWDSNCLFTGILFLISPIETKKIIDDVIQTLPHIFYPLGDHLILTGGAFFISILIAFPLAIICIYNKKFALNIINFANLVQAVPSFAVVAIVVPFLGIGFTPAIIAIILRALLPIIKNTYIGLSSMDNKLVEFSHGLGLTDWQILLHVRIPNAYPAIFAGLKFAFILANGIAIITAFIGSGGYGDMIFMNINRNLTAVFMYILPVILFIDIFVDVLLSYIERKDFSILY